MATCSALIRGSIYSQKGGNRYDPCHHEARFTVMGTDEHWIIPVHVCGIHVRRFNAMNESFWKIDDLLGRERRPAYYRVEAI